MHETLIYDGEAGYVSDADPDSEILIPGADSTWILLREKWRRAEKNWNNLGRAEKMSEILKRISNRLISTQNHFT